MVTPRQVEGASGAQETHLREYWKVLWQGRYTVLAVFLLIVAITAVLTFTQTPIYRATATLEVQPQPRQLAPGQDVSGLGVAGYGWWAEEKYHNTQIEIIKSRDLSERAFAILALDSHPGFQQLSDPIEALRRRIQVTPRRETGLIEVSIMGANPDEIAEWVNAVSDAYVERNIEKARNNVALAVSEIRNQIDQLQNELNLEQQDLLNVLQDQKIFDPEGQKEAVRQKLQEYNKDLGRVRIQADQLENRLDKISELQRRGADPTTVPELARDEEFKELQRQKLQLEREIDRHKVTLKPGHPTYDKAVSDLARVNGKIGTHMNMLVQSWLNELALLVKHEEDLNERIRDAEEAMLKVGTATSKVEIARTDAETKKRIFEVITETMEEAQLTASLLTNNVQVLDEARPPLSPVKPRKRANLIIGAMFGMFLGIGLVFFLDYLDNTFRTPQDIEKHLGLSVLGVIPKSQGLQQLAARAVKEAYQSLRTSIIFSSKNRQRKTVLVTSTGPQEGKSSVAANLARVLAGAGDRVLVIDCDLRRPTQHVHFEVSREHGLTNYLAAPEGEDDWSEFVRPTEVPTLHVLPCGPIPPSPPELLGSSRFKRMLLEVRETYDWVLVDSPPAASLADSSLLASLADMVVLVVRHNQTDRDLVVRTVQQVRALNATLVGAVLNNVDLERAYSKDYYYAGYYYYGDDKDSRGKRRRDDSRAKARAG